MNPAARLADGLLEATVVGSFSRIGYQTRRLIMHWPEPHPMPGTRALVTGATSGLGAAVATQLARLGADVTFIARDEGRALRAKEAISNRAGRPVDFLLADMADFGSLRRAAGLYLDVHGAPDVVIHNAGALSSTFERAPDGTELTVAAHVLGPFLLTGLLLPALQGRDHGRGPARVLTVSSGGMYTERFVLEGLDAGPDGYDGVKAYARAKRAQVVLTHEWAARVDPSEVVFHAMHPGWADTPGVRSSLPGFFRVTRPILRTPEQGVDTLVWLSQAPEAAQISGCFWLDRRVRSEYKLPWTRPADAGADQARLWAWCEQRTGWRGPERR